VERTLPLTPEVILVVEDDPADQKLIKASLKGLRVPSDVRTAASAEEALSLLRSFRDQSGQAGKPDLILLDLNMPGMGGKEFLKQIKADDSLRQIPVVIVTTSSSERDIVDGYALQAAGYVHKPATLDEFKQVMNDIQDYWFLLCRLPKKEHSPL